MPTPLQSKSGSASATSVAVTFATANLSAGSKIIAVIASAGATAISSVTATGGNTLTAVPSGGANQGAARCYVYACDASGAGGTSMVGTKPTVTATYGGAVALSMVIQEVPGLLAGNTTAMADGTPATLTGTAASTGSPSYTSTAAGEYLLSGYGDEGAGNTVVIAGGWTADPANINTSSTFVNCMLQYKDSTGGSETDGFTGADTSGWAIVEVAFKLGVTSFNSGPNSAGAGGDLGGGTGSWTNPGNITADDGSAATWAVV